MDPQVAILLTFRVEFILITEDGRTVLEIFTDMQYNTSLDDNGKLHVSPEKITELKLDAIKQASAKIPDQVPMQATDRAKASAIIVFSSTPFTLG